MAILESDAVTGKQITTADVPSPEEIELAAALELVKNDASTAQSWLEGNQWNENWRQIDILYDSPRVFSVWEGGTPKPSVVRYTLAQHVNSIHPTLIEGLFYNDECFVADPRPGTEAEVVRARSTVIKVQMDQMEFANEVSMGLFQTILHGTGIYKWGLQTVEEDYYTYEQAGAPLSQTNSLGQNITADTAASRKWKEIKKTRTVIKPFFENREIRNVLVDPKLKIPDIRRAGFVIDKFYLTLVDILDLKADPNYAEYLTETEDEIKAWFDTPKEQPAQLGNLDTNPGTPAIAGQGQPDWMETSQDPYEQGLMCLERWDAHKVITVLNNKKVIQSRPNPYGVIPFYSSNWYNRIKAFYGLGVGKMVGTDQRLQQGLENAGLELLQLIMDPPFAVSDDANVPTQNVRFRKGGMIKIKGDVRSAIAPLEMPRLPLAEMFGFLQNSQSKAEAASGANELFSQGAMPGPGTAGRSSATRNATGAAGVIGAQAGRMQGPLEHFINQVFVPWVYQLDLLNRRFVMTTPDGAAMVRDILSDELGNDYKFDESGFLSGRVKYGVKAGAHLAARKLAAQMLPVITQIFDNPQIQKQLNEVNEEYVDIKELLLLWLETIGLHNRRSLIKPMTDQMKQAQKQQGEQAKLQAAMALDDHKAGNKSELQQQKSKEGIVRDVINRSLDQGGDYLLRKEFEDSPGQLASQP
ncbi:MAG: hypothetical protein JWQ87_5459 [Candidatus Sulfotelmatobacter sp.]|nr:hypothetical protein [Candidatus Sulfotelmatobacter sp.]